MPCTAKKFEAKREELRTEWGAQLTDEVITTRELIWLAKCLGVDFAKLPDEEFDSPLGESSGAADIFGATGGVMEAALRTAYTKITGEACPNINFTQVRGVTGVKEAVLNIKGTDVKIAVSNGLNNAKTLLNRVIKDKSAYHLIEVMACPGGCVAGGGQPYPPEGMNVLDPAIAELRASALYSIEDTLFARESGN